MLAHKLMRAEGILLLTPGAPLESTDFKELAAEIDPYIEETGKLHGLMIEADAFPGWKDFAALVAHLIFVKNHHQKVQKVAVVSDSSFLTHAPKVASHFVQAELRHFDANQKAEALRWLQGENH